MKIPAPQQTLPYGKSYLDWKGWDESSFGVLDALQTYYFDAEMMRTGLELNRKLQVLEIGFGNGSFLAYAKRRGWEIVGTEANAHLINAASLFGFHAIPADDLHTLQHGMFDLVVAFDVLEHVPPLELLGFVRKLAEKLKPGGILLARFPNADSPFGLVNQQGDITHMCAIGLGKVRYLSIELEMRIVFFGAEARPVRCGSFTQSIRRLLGLALTKSIDFFVNKTLLQNLNIAFCSSNVVMILQSGNGDIKASDSMQPGWIRH